jgi:hypothetical protein
MRYLLAAAAAAALSAAAQAHFVFVYVEGTEARLVFGHTAAPDPSASAARCEKTVLAARDAAGKETKLAAVTKGDGNFYRAAVPAGTAVVYGVTAAGVTQRGDNPAMLSWYYPKAVVGDPFAPTAAVKGAALDVVPVRDGDKVRFRVTAAGRPAADAEVTVGLPGKGEDEAKTMKTDKDGLTESFAEAGRYCVAARRTDATPGELDGKKYASVRHTATVVFDFARPGR